MAQSSPAQLLSLHGSLTHRQSAQPCRVLAIVMRPVAVEMLVRPHPAAVNVLVRPHPAAVKVLVRPRPVAVEMLVTAAALAMLAEMSVRPWPAAR